MESLETKIGNTMLIVGRIEGDGNVSVEGRVEGNISIRGDLHIESSGEVKSAVQARNIYVYGILVGDAVAAEKIELAPGGRMIGNVRSPRFLINEGAAYRGSVDMVDFYESPDERTQDSRWGRSANTSNISQNSSQQKVHGQQTLDRSRHTVSQSHTGTAVAPLNQSLNNSSSTLSSNISNMSSKQVAQTVSEAKSGVSRSNTPNKITSGTNVYTPPPLPRPPEFMGTKKAIIIKKKNIDGSQQS